MALPSTALRAAQRPSRWAELVLLFVAAPALMAVGSGVVPVLPALWVGAAYACWQLRRDPTAPLRDLWRPSALTRTLPRILGRFALIAAALIAGVVALAPARLFDLPRERPIEWAILMVVYPLVSVLPQEFVWRTFFFHRYRRELSPSALVWGSAVAFGFMHVAFVNVVAVVLTLAAGLLLADTYARTRSLAAVAVEHALYGCLAFSVGLGSYLSSGALGDS